LAPQDSQNCGRNVAKRKQSDADFAPNAIHMVTNEIIINSAVGTLILYPAGMHYPAWDDAFVSSSVLTVQIAVASHSMPVYHDV